MVDEYDAVLWLLPRLRETCGMNAEQRQQIGNKVEEARKVKGWYQKDLAEAAGVAVNTVRALEKGESVSAGTIRKVLDAVGVEPVADARRREGFPPDVQMVLDLVGMYLVALPEEERAAVAYSITRMLMERDGK